MLTRLRAVIRLLLAWARMQAAHRRCRLLERELDDAVQVAREDGRVITRYPWGHASAATLRRAHAAALAQLTRARRDFARAEAEARGA